MLSMLLVLQSGQRRTQAELDSRVALGATPCFCLALMLHPISSLLPQEYLGINETQGRPWPGSSSGPKHVSLDLGRMRRMLGVHAARRDQRHLSMWCALGRPSSKATSMSWGREGGWPVRLPFS